MHARIACAFLHSHVLIYMLARMCIHVTYAFLHKENTTRFLDIKTPQSQVTFGVR